MPEGSGAARSTRQATDGGSDRLGALPDDFLLDILSLLPSLDSVRTCVLARRWRDLWKRVPALRIDPTTTSTTRRFWGARALNGFVNHLLFLRDRSPLRVAEFNSFSSHGGDDFDEVVQYLEVWVRYSLSRPVTKLCIASDDMDERWLLPKGLITSEHLTSLELTRVMTEDDLDFSSCVSLLDLKMLYCSIYCNRITSPSLKRLSIAVCRFDNVRTQISVPNLICLELVDCSQRVPLLESMPLLVEASVAIQNCSDYCVKGYEVGDCGDDSCEGCCGSNYGKNTCVLLQGLSSCTNLELTATTAHFILRKDLMRCPVFSKLKNVLLDEWCITSNLGALICFLQHSPVLEKLTLQFPEIHKNLVETGASYDLRKQPLLLKDLTVEVTCHEGDEQLVHKVFDVLSSYGLLPQKIIIKPYPLGPLEVSVSHRRRFGNAVLVLDRATIS